VVGRIYVPAHAQRAEVWFLRLGLTGAANATRHWKAAHIVVVRNARVDLDFRLVDAVVTD
jgi:hypothetical protein